MVERKELRVTVAECCEEPDTTGLRFVRHSDALVRTRPAGGARAGPGRACPRRPPCAVRRLAAWRPAGRNPIDAKPGASFAAPSPVAGKVAQLVEQRTENPCVPGSIPGLATTYSQRLTVFGCFVRKSTGPLLGHFLGAPTPSVSPSAIVADSANGTDGGIDGRSGEA